MLKGISPCLSPELLKTLCEMGHADAILLADAHFPGHTLGQRVVRADGLSTTQLLDAILPLLELERTDDAVAMMQPDGGDAANTAVEADFMGAVKRHTGRTAAPARLERQEFYDQARRAYAIVMTGETRPYGNVLLIKGVTPV